MLVMEHDLEVLRVVQGEGHVGDPGGLEGEEWVAEALRLAAHGLFQPFEALGGEAGQEGGFVRVELACALQGYLGLARDGDQAKIGGAVSPEGFQGGLEECQTLRAHRGPGRGDG